MRASSVADAAGDRFAAASRYCARSAVASKTTTPGVPSGTLSTRARKWGVTTTARISMPPEPSSAPSADHAVLATGGAARLTLIGGLAVLLAALMLVAALVGAYPLSLGDDAGGRRPAADRRAAALARSTPCCSRCGCRACLRPWWSAQRSRRRAPPTRRCSATRWCRPTSWACRRAPASAPCSASSCRCPWPASSSRPSSWGLPRSASSTASPRWCAGATRSWCWCWPAWWSARSPARPSRS